MPEPTTPPTENTDTKAILEQITALNETIGGLQENIETIQADVEAIKTPAEPETPPDKPAYQPKSWDDIPKTAKEIAEQTYEEKEAQKQAAAEKAKADETAADKNIQTEINTQVATLEKSGALPPIKDANNKNDPGRIARRELFGLAADLGTTNLAQVADNLSNLHKENIHYDFESKKYLRSSGANPGQDSPIGSSSGSIGTLAGGPAYSIIHKAKSLSELARLAGG